METVIQVQDYQDYVVDAVDVVEFQLIRERRDLEDPDTIFHPAMAHQIFGDEESIFGYKDLRVRILYSAGALNIYLGMEYSCRVDDMNFGEIRADDIINTLAHKLPEGCYIVNMDEFLKTLDKADKFLPFGEKLGEYKHRDKDGNERLFEFYQCDYKMPAFLKYFGRLQTFVLWFIDAACYIELDDPQWNYFVCYEKYRNDAGEDQYASVGYLTVYEYYAYPQNIRPRISQMLILPPFRQLSIGTKLLEAVYKFYLAQKRVVDITVEGAGDDFDRLRDFADARLCMELKCFSRDELKKGFTKELVHEARVALKLNPRQCRKIYEILRLYYTNRLNTEEYKAYRLEVKRRLSAVYYKELRDNKNGIEKSKMIAAMLAGRLPNVEQRIAELKEAYDELEARYNAVICKLRNYHS